MCYVQDGKEVKQECKEAAMQDLQLLCKSTRTAMQASTKVDDSR